MLLCALLANTVSTSKNAYISLPKNKFKLISGAEKEAQLSTWSLKREQTGELFAISVYARRVMGWIKYFSILFVLLK